MRNKSDVTSRISWFSASRQDLLRFAPDAVEVSRTSSPRRRLCPSPLTPRCCATRRRVAVLVMLVLATLVPTATAGASTVNAAAVVPAPSVLAVSATPSALSFHGGTVAVNGRVRNVTTCQLHLVSHQGFAVAYANGPRRCSSTFSAHVTIAANPTTVPRTVTFELVAHNGKKSSARRFFIRLAPHVVPKPVQHGTQAALRLGSDTITGQDTFARANGNLGPGWTGMTVGGLAVVNQQVRGTNAGGKSGDIRTGETYGSDQYSEVHVTSEQLSESQWVGPAVRAQAGGQDLYVGIYFWNNGSPELMLFLSDNGNWSELGGTRTGPLTAGTILTLTAVGSSLAFAVNGTVVISASDSTLTGGAPGIMANDLATAGNWSGGNSGFQVDYRSTANGIQTYNVISPENGYGVQTLRVLSPKQPAAGVAHNFLFVLPVEAGLGDSYGDGLTTLQSLDVEDHYNLTIVEPTFTYQPWYANSVSDPNLQYESFMATELVPWVDQNLATTGAEQNWLIGFSKSGYGTQDLLLKYPNLFAVAASWDFPADMSSYNQLGSIPAANYGTEANFAANYQLTPAFVAAHKTPFLTRQRIWIGGYSVLAKDVSDYGALLTSQGILYTPGPSQYRAHRWDSGWMPAAVAALYQDSLNLPAGP
jgi:hypothetical protein